MNWEIVGNTLQKQFKLESFDQIVGKLNTLLEVANEQNHHPDFMVKNYNEILFSLSTHTENSITQKDYTLAQNIDAIFTI